MARSPLDDVGKTVQDAAFVSVGLSVIALQRLAVRRQELRKAISEQAEGAKGALSAVGTLLGERWKAVEERVGATIDRR